MPALGRPEPARSPAFSSPAERTRHGTEKSPVASSSPHPSRLPYLGRIVNRQNFNRPDNRRRLDGGPRHAPHPQGVIRTAARAVIVRDGKILTVVLRDRDGDFYVLPGGGQTHGETLSETVLRECREEIGAEVEVGALLYMREYVGKNHGFAQRHAHFHQVEAVFRCTLKSEPGAENGTARDNRQVGLAWVPVAELARFRFFPNVLKDFVQGDDIAVPVTYLGDIN